MFNDDVVISFEYNKNLRLKTVKKANKWMVVVVLLLSFIGTYQRIFKSQFNAMTKQLYDFTNEIRLRF